MNRLLAVFSIALVVAFLAGGCAMAVAPVMGSVYTDVKAPLGATSNAVSTKSGSAEATSILGLVAMGDASIETAARNGGITKIHHVDYHSTSILGIYAKFVVTVYGE